MPSGTGQYSTPAFRGVRPSGHAAASPVKVIQAYRFALDPSPAQERSLRSHAGAARFAWNWGLARVRERYAVEGKWYSGIDLHKLWNAAKKVDRTLAWWSDNSKCVYQEAFNDLYRALRDFDKSRKGLRRVSDALRKATSGLAARYETVVAEDLNVTGMLTNHRLARAVADQGFGQARRMLSLRPSGTAERS
jgi:transposase